ncbi:uncharacterized protein ColSpa_06452 [Colletotrichum spaethianum]|uniref:MYND-type domain-containing protein n=1 Tax=Colletotrichum spaethianum TaxID=700344 RepID=A0AA37LCT1_9PEZI|nr:uncharacterized protein ColSpa_06452 [Colletotrichum spaethianum]GKT46271.1 hypothetical protein ColSpa_06452 [Colletotrichum spaethianum]
MEHPARSFNALPRPNTTPTGLPNRWVFGIRHVPLNPPGDLVVAVHPPSRYIVQGGPGQILSLPSASAKAKALVPLLLDAFIHGHKSPGGAQTDDPQPFAPWAWSVDDPELAAAIEDELRLLGVNDALHSVEGCSVEEKKILDETWLKFLDKLVGMFPATSSPLTVPPGDDSKCHGCGLDRGDFPAPLKMCSACKQAWYHSQDCQRQHWKQHKKTCLANRSGPSASPHSTAGAAGSAGTKSDAYTYYNQFARSSPDAQSLLRSLHLDPASAEGTAKPLRHLVITGLDSPENMKRLFGPNALDIMKEDHESARLEVFLDPPRGSPSYKMSSYDDCSALHRSMRPPTEVEQQKLQELRDMQQLIRQKVGVGKSPSKGDMQSILTSFGPNWPTKLQLYMLAVNTMDQGVN